AGPVLARGGAADWTIAAAPLAALWLGPALAGRLPGLAAGRLGQGLGQGLGGAVAGLLPLALAWLLLRAR
ncbi:hypothetical protein, partial [Paracraurococcus ruber]|uniref:hypothetical protein n=1 Tax=Paracraurococcus ruber TaxID=77675 RepID=UPI001960DA25